MLLKLINNIWDIKNRLTYTYRFRIEGGIMNKIRVLQCCLTLNDGGVERLLFNYYQKIYNYIIFDFFVYRQNKGILEDDFRKLGSKIYRPSADKEKTEIIKEILSKEKYDVVHLHGYFDIKIIYACLKAGVKVRILHSHTTNVESSMTAVLKKKLAEILSTDFWACGKNAGQAMWGDKPFYVLNNAIDINDFAFNPELRDKYRCELGLGEKDFGIINVGRLCEQKNQAFMISVMEEICQIYSNIKLYIVGDGALYEELSTSIKERGLERCIILLGSRNDVAQMLNAFDLFVLPSVFEGLPVSAIEAQANGLTCLVSDRVTDEIILSKNSKSLTLDTDVWVKNIINILNQTDFSGFQRFSGRELVAKAGYDIDSEAKKLVSKYYDLINSKAK